jgi:hypothetical protein
VGTKRLVRAEYVQKMMQPRGSKSLDSRKKKSERILKMKKNKKVQI